MLGERNLYYRSNIYSKIGLLYIKLVKLRNLQADSPSKLTES